jgi:CIC family chloride channel protein
MGHAKGIPLRAFAIFLLAATIGVAGGLLGSAFQLGLNWLQHALTGSRADQPLSEAVREHLNWWQTLLVPTVGGLGAGVVLLLLRGRKPPFGVSDLVALVQLRKGVIRVRESMIQILSSACTIASGGSIGREGANSQIAATVASVIARIARLGSRPRSVLLGCGVAAGMATSYNAPITGAIFVMEVVLGNFAMDVCAPIVVSAVLATMLRDRWLGSEPLYANMLPKDLDVLSPHLVLSALLLGVACGFAGILFRRALDLGRRGFTALRLPLPLALALGGLVVGGIGVFMPETWGNGMEVIARFADQAPTLTLLLTLFLWKVVATVATVGSGGLGGIFTPNLVIGAAFGGFFASAIGLFHGAGTPPEVLTTERAIFALVGMGGLCAATMHAPVTAVVLVFELTRHYEIVPPVMLCSIVASIVASMLDEDSYYTAAIKAKGEQLPGGIEDMAIRSTFVRDVRQKDCVTVTDTASFDEVMQKVGSHRGDTIYVVDGQGTLVGRIDLHDVKSFINDPSLSRVVIAADLTRPVVAVRADDSLATVMPRFADPDVAELAVVTPSAPPRLLGRVRRQDVIAAIGSEVLGQQRRRSPMHARIAGSDSMPLPQGYEFAFVPVPDTWVGQAIDALPPASLAEVVVVMAARPAAGGDTEHVAAVPGLVLQDGWQVAVLGTRAAIERLRRGAGGDDDAE